MFPLHDINRAHRRPYMLYLLVLLNLEKRGGVGEL